MCKFCSAHNLRTNLFCSCFMNEAIYVYLPSKSEDVQHCHQFKTSRNCWEPEKPSTVLKYLDRSSPHLRVVGKTSWHGNKTKRCNYVQKQRTWVSAKIWNIWLQQKSVCCRRAGEQYNNECLQTTLKHGGGSLRVWNCISVNGIEDLVGTSGVHNAEKYKEILIHHTVDEMIDWRQIHSTGQLQNIHPMPLGTIFSVKREPWK